MVFREPNSSFLEPALPNLKLKKTFVNKRADTIQPILLLQSSKTTHDLFRRLRRLETFLLLFRKKMNLMNFFQLGLETNYSPGTLIPLCKYLDGKKLPRSGTILVAHFLGKVRIQRVGAKNYNQLGLSERPENVFPHGGSGYCNCVLIGVVRYQTTIYYIIARGKRLKGINC